MTIVIDYDNDQIIVRSKGCDTAQYRGTAYKLKDVEHLLEEIFNRLDSSRLASATPSFEITLEKQDDGRFIGIGEY